jgi:galactosylceramidase
MPLAALLIGPSAASFSLTDEFGIGPSYAGIGGLSGGGATSRFLPDYAPQPRSDILDMLFTPQFGASLQLLKVEIGGDGQSTEGTEMSHMRNASDLNVRRGYEGWLLSEAKRRNADLGTLALAWAWPAWVGCPGGDLSSPDCDGKTPYSIPQQTAGYVASWVAGMRSEYNVTIDVAGSWNERAYNADYMVALRAALDAANLTETRLVCDDFDWSCAKDMAGNPALASAVDFISGHDPMPATAAAPGKPLYDSEGFHTTGSDSGAASWIVELNSRYLQYNQSLNIAWNLLAAYGEGTAFWPHGLMHAFQPWAGWYSVPASIWATAHYTQFTSIRAPRSWHYLLVGGARGGSGALSTGGSYVGLVDLATGNFSVVIEKAQPGGAAPETATFVLGGSLAGVGRVAVWSTLLSVAGGAPVGESEQFVRLGEIAVVNGSFSVDVAVGQILTVTSLLGAGRKGQPAAAPPPPSTFPLAYFDDFNACAAEAQAKYVTDFNGAMACEDTGDAAHGTVLRQVVPKAPIRWWTDSRPHSIVGDSTWTDVNATLDFRCTTPGGSAMIGARASIGSATYITDGAPGISAEDSLPGLWFSLACAGGANGEGPAAWALYARVADVGSARTALASGTLAAPLPVMTWHTVGISVVGRRVAGSLDGAAVFDLDLPASAAVPPAGWVGFGTAGYGDFTQFDNLAISAAAARCSAAGGAGSAVAVWPCSSASPGQRWVFTPSVASPPWGTLVLEAGAGTPDALCLTVDTSKNRYGSYNVVAAACAAGSLPPPSQLFSVNANNGTVTTQGGADMRPGSPMCLDVTAESYALGNGLDVYPCSPVANQQFRVLEGGLLSSGDPGDFYCAGACAAWP